MLLEIFKRKEAFPLNIIYFLIEIFFIFIGYISLFIFYIFNINKKIKYSVPLLHTIGDSLEHIDFFRLKNYKKKKYKILTLNCFPTNKYLKFLLKNKDYIFYNEIIYIFFLNFLKIFVNENNNLIKRYNIIIQKLLFKYFSDLNFYNNDSSLIKKRRILVSNKFNSAYIDHHIKFSKTSSKFDKYKLQSKLGYLNIKKLNGYNFRDEERLLSNLNLKNKKFVCLHIRTEKEKKSLQIRSSYNFNSYLPLIKFLEKKKILVVLIGSKNRNIHKFFGKVKNVIDYRNSNYQSLYNDLYLVNKSKFLISQISGPLMFAVIFGKPFLSLDVATIEDIQLYDKGIYFLKKIKSIKKNINIKYSEILNHPMIYKDNLFEFNKYKAVELNSTEKIKALMIFLKMLEDNNFKFLDINNQMLNKILDNDFHKISKWNYNKIFVEEKLI